MEEPGALARVRGEAGGLAVEAAEEEGDVRQERGDEERQREPDGIQR